MNSLIEEKFFGYGNFLGFRKPVFTEKIFGVDNFHLVIKKTSAPVTTEKIFRALPDDFKNKSARPFLLACGLNDAEFFDDVPDDLTLARLPEFLREISFEFKDDELKIFAKEIRFNVKAAAKKIVVALSLERQELEIVRRLSEGVALKEIKKKFGVTDEKISQIEMKLVGRFMSYQDDAKKIFYFLHALTDGKSLITVDDMKKFLRAADAEVLCFFSVKTNLSSEYFHFNKKLNAFVFTDAASLNEDDEKISNCGDSTLNANCARVLKERFPDGYKIGDEKFYSRFVRYFQEFFAAKRLPAQSTVDAKIKTVGVLCDCGKYIHPDFVQVSPKIIDHVKDFVDGSERTAISYREIFDGLKNFFVGTQVTNYYFLQGVIKFFKLPYTLRPNYLTKTPSFNVVKEFDSFVAERGEVSIREIKEKFHADINLLLARCPEVIRVGDGKFIHAKHLDLRTEDFKSIKKFLRKNCSSPVHSRVLFDSFSERFKDFMTRNAIQNHGKLFGVLQHMFRNDFKFSRPYISSADIKSVSNKKILLRLLKGTDEIEIEDLCALCEENGITFVAKNLLADSFRPEFIRVDEHNLMRAEAVGITDEKISAVVKNIRAAIKLHGGRLAAQTFEDYEWLPRLKINWNSFVLESVVSLADDAPPKLKIPSASTKFSSAIFLSKEFAEDDYQSFLKKILIAEHEKKPFRSEKEIFNWLKRQGLCGKKLPKCLDTRKFLDGGLFKLDE